MLKKMTMEMMMIIMLSTKLMDMMMMRISMRPIKIMMRYYLIKGHSGGADGHSISSSLGVGSFAPVSLLVNMVITMRKRWRRRRRRGRRKRRMVTCS